MDELRDRPEAAAEEARRLLGQNRAAEAAGVMQRCLGRHPGTASDYMLLGVALAQAGEGLAAIQPLEQAVAMEPGNAAAHFNLGQVYRQGGRQREALAEFECALQLRPNYPAAAHAAEELRPRVPAPPLAEESRAWTPPAAASVPSPAAAPPRTAAPKGPRPSAWRGILAAAWQLIISPGEAVNGGLDTFFNTPGAIGAVVNLFLTAVGVAVLGGWLTTSESELGAVEVWQILPYIAVVIVVQVIATAGTIAVYNKITGGSDDFIAEFGSLAMSFAMIVSTIALVTTPLSLILTVAGGSGGVLTIGVVKGIWSLILEVMLVMAATDIGPLAAWALLVLANIVSGVTAGVLAAALGVMG